MLALLVRKQLLFSCNSENIDCGKNLLMVGKELRNVWVFFVQQGLIVT